MPIFDIYCEKCDRTTIDVWLKSDEDAPNCEECDSKRIKICNCSHFTLNCDNKTQSCGWAHNNYEHNCYWDDVKKQRAEGKNVKAINEN